VTLPSVVAVVRQIAPPEVSAIPDGPTSRLNVSVEGENVRSLGDRDMANV
jgi:hypothetical protein